MKTAFVLLSLFAVSTLAQDVVQVVCQQSSIIARIQKQLVANANHKMENVHLNDRTCIFDEEDGDFYVKKISPITSCGTHYEANDTHVVFTNSISTVDTGPTYPYGIVIGSQANTNVLSALISCTYKIDLNVSAMFIPNITIILIQMPDAFEHGEFKAAMTLYADPGYRIPFVTPPIMDPNAMLYVGVNLLDDTSSDIYLLMEECWGTISNDPTATPKYPLVQEGCAVPSSGDGQIQVTQNGNGHQGLWRSPVFKFVGDGEDFENVWLHCDLQLCINQACEPTCLDGRRRKRSIGDGRIWGPGDFIKQHIISVGPIRRLTVTEVSQNETKTVYVDVVEDQKPGNIAIKGKQEANTFWTLPAIVIIGALGGLALICVILALVAVIIRARGRTSNTGFPLGVSNKAFA